MLHERTEIDEDCGHPYIPLYPRLQRIERLLDRVKIRRIRRQILKLDASISAELLNETGAVDTSIIHYNNLARLQLRQEALLEPLLEQLYRYRSLYDKRVFEIAIHRDSRQYAPPSRSCKALDIKAR
jgi:hypothetical protein